MRDDSNKTVLITGANSGVGLEAAAQFAEAGWGRVILACRSLEKAEAASASLVERTGKDVFGVLAIDTSEVSSAHAAADALSAQKIVVDLLVLNAGASSVSPKFNTDGVEITWASTLVGHHVLTMRMLADGRLSSEACILIAGSEGARGNLPGMKVHDIRAIAKEQFGGDWVATIDALARIKGPLAFENMNEYVTAKLVVAWWAAALARKVPRGMRVNAVSPGSAPDSGFARDASFMMRAMLPIMKVMGPLMGMAGSLESAARRYLEVAARGETGEFFATAHRKKLVGPVGVQLWPAYFADEASQDAGFNAVVKMTGTEWPGLATVRC